MRADDIIRLYWQGIGERVSFQLKYPHILNFHAVLSACLSDESISIRGHKSDLRVHPFILRSSGSGKALSYDLAETLAKKVGLDWKTRMKITEAGLVGTVRQTKDEITIIYGDAYDTDILGFTEAGILLALSSRQDTLRDNVNTIMDAKGMVHKRLALGTVEYETHVTLVLSSQPNELAYEAIKTGFLPRCFVYYEHLPIEYYSNVMGWLSESIGIDESTEVQKDLDIVVERLKEIRSHDFRFKFSQDARELLKTIGERFLKIVVTYNNPEELKVFTTRYFMLVCKLAAHHAALELRHTIERGDVEYAMNLVIISFNSVAEFISGFLQKTKLQERLERQLSKLREQNVKEVKLSGLSRRLRPLTVSRLISLLEPYEARSEITIDREKRTLRF